MAQFVLLLFSPVDHGVTALGQAVILQTALYSKRSQGRLSVYWGDQVFIPTQATPLPATLRSSRDDPASAVCVLQPYDTKAEYEADILAQLGDKPTKEEWEKGGFSSYGLIGFNPSSGKNGWQLEKARRSRHTPRCLAPTVPTVNRSRLRQQKARWLAVTAGRCRLR